MALSVSVCPLLCVSFRCCSPVDRQFCALPTGVLCFGFTFHISFIFHLGWQFPRNPQTIRVSAGCIVFLFCFSFFGEQVIGIVLPTTRVQCHISKLGQSTGRVNFGRGPPPKPCRFSWSHFSTMAAAVLHVFVFESSRLCIVECGGRKREEIMLGGKKIL